MKSSIMPSRRWQGLGWTVPILLGRGGCREGELRAAARIWILVYRTALVPWAAALIGITYVQAAMLLERRVYVVPTGGRRPQHHRDQALAGVSQAGGRLGGGVATQVWLSAARGLSFWGLHAFETTHVQVTRTMSSHTCGHKRRRGYPSAA